MQNNTAYYSTSTKWSIWWICTFTVSVFSCLIVSKWQWLSIHLHMRRLHVCMCVRAGGLRGYECLHLLSVQCMSVCIYTMPRSECLHPLPEARRCEEIIKGQERQIHEREILCRCHRPQRRECSWLEDTDKLSIMCARPLPFPSLIARQSHSDFKNGFYLDS